MENYVDGFVLPVPRAYLNEYKNAAEKIAEIWKEYGALEYFECIGDDLKLKGVRSFIDLVNLKEGEVVVFGWAVFPSKEIRDKASKQVCSDSRITESVAPLINPERLIFDAERMVYGGFQPLVQSSAN